MNSGTARGGSQRRYTRQPSTWRSSFSLMYSQFERITVFVRFQFHRYESLLTLLRACWKRLGSPRNIVSPIFGAIHVGVIVGDSGVRSSATERPFLRDGLIFSAAFAKHFCLVIHWRCCVTWGEPRVCFRLSGRIPSPVAAGSRHRSSVP